MATKVKDDWSARQNERERLIREAGPKEILEASKYIGKIVPVKCHMTSHMGDPVPMLYFGTHGKTSNGVYLFISSHLRGSSPARTQVPGYCYLYFPQY